MKCLIYVSFMSPPISLTPTPTPKRGASELLIGKGLELGDAVGRLGVDVVEREIGGAGLTRGELLGVWWGEKGEV